MLGDVVTVKAVATDTGGAYALFETRTAPQQGTPSQLQRYDDESFVVLEGNHGCRITDETIELGPGAHAFVPRGTPHTYTNVGAGTARMRTLVSPGGIHERFVADVGEPVGDPAAAKYGIEFVPPQAV